MGMRGSLAVLLASTIAVASAYPSNDKLGELQARFDRESNPVHKAKQLDKLGDAQFLACRDAEKADDHAAVDTILEKYRDNARAALEALKKAHPDAERHSGGYRQLEMHVRKGLREVDESIVTAPDEYKPPLQIVRQDLVTIDDELLHMLFPIRPGEKPAKRAPNVTPPPALETHP